MSTTVASNLSSVSAVATCVTVTPDKNGYVPIDDCRNLWPYYPSFGAAVLFSVLFGISTVLHVFQASIYRKKFCWVIIVAGCWETAGFILRTIATRNQLSLGVYMPEELLILLAPLWINAFDYMILGRMIYYFLPEQTLFGIKANRLAKYFVCFDIVAFIIQGIGGSIASGGPQEDPATIMLGIHIYMAGIGLQEFFILVFVFLATKFHRRMCAIDRSGQGTHEPGKWKALLYALYSSLFLISVRIIYRLVQYSGGVESTIPTHEAYFYCFEALPMVIAVWIMNVTHPGRTLVGANSEFPKKTRAQKKEEKRRKKEAKEARRKRRGQPIEDIDSELQLGNYDGGL